MILTVGIIVILIISFSFGRHRGLLRMLFGLVSYVVAILIAKASSMIVGTKLAALFPIVKTTSQTGGSALTADNGNQFLYNGIAFIIIFIIVRLICRWVIRRFNLITKLPVIHQVNALLGGVMNVLLTYVTIFFLLTIFQVWPSDWWQTQMSTSGLATWIINSTPVLSQQVVYWLTGQ